MKLGSITFLAFIIGALWSGLWMVVVGLLLMFISGIVLTPPISIAALIGGLGGLFHIMIAPEHRGRSHQFIYNLILAALLMLLTFAEPFGAPFGESILDITLATKSKRGLKQLTTIQTIFGMMLRELSVQEMYALANFHKGFQVPARFVFMPTQVM